MSLSSSEQNIHIFQHYIIKQHIYSMGFSEQKRLFNGETILAELIFREAQRACAEELSLSHFSIEKTVAATKIAGKATIVYKFPSVKFASGCKYIFFIELEHDLPLFITVEKEEEDKQLHLYEWVSGEEKVDHGIVDESYYSVRSMIFVSILGNSNTTDEDDPDVFFKTDSSIQKVKPSGSIIPAPPDSTANPYPDIYINNPSQSSSNVFQGTSASLYAQNQPQPETQKTHKGFFKLLAFILFLLNILGLFIESRGLWVSSLILFITALIVVRKENKIAKKKGAVIATILIPVLLILVILLPKNCSSCSTNTSGYEKVDLSKSNFEDYFYISSAYSFNTYYWGGEYADIEIEIYPNAFDYENNSYSSETISINITYWFSPYNSSNYLFSTDQIVTINLYKGNEYLYSGTQTLSCDENDNYCFYKITSVSGTIYI